jgi:GNAT superfamily N-acetyltransferase
MYGRNIAGPSIVEQMGLIHGPRDLIARYIAFADRAARDLGLRLRLSQDFDRLIALNSQHSDSWELLSPIFNPKHNSLRRDNTFLIEALDDFDETVMTSAGRLYDHGDRSIADELRSLRVFYDDPAPHIAAGERVEVTAPTAEHLCGRVMFSGAVWVRPDYRRHGLTKIIPRLTRSYALTQWNTPVFWAGISRNLDKIGVTRAYGSWHAEDRITTHMPSWCADHDMLFLSMGQATLIRDIAGSVEAYDLRTGASHWIDSAIANQSSLPDRHSMISRS